MKAKGFTLIEMLIALTITAVLMTGASRFMPVFTAGNLRQLLALQLWDETELIALTLEKAIRRAGYCHGKCQGKGVQLIGGNCLLLRWDEQSNGRREPVTSAKSDFYGYRLRDGSLETQRGVANCQGSGWEKLNDPKVVRVTRFALREQKRAVKFTLATASLRWPGLQQQVTRSVTRENRDVTTAGSRFTEHGAGDTTGGHVVTAK